MNFYRLSGGSWYQASQTITNVDGDYTSEGLVPDIYKVDFGIYQNSDYLGEVYDDVAHLDSGAEEVVVTAGVTVLGINASLALAAKIAGRVTGPDGRQASSRTGEVQLSDGQAIYADTDRLGVYTVEELRDGELVATHRYAVNLFSPRESAIAPQRDLAVPQTSGAQSTISRERDGRQELWRWLALLALLVLVIEWLVYQRNGLAYLRQRWRERRA